MGGKPNYLAVAGETGPYTTKAEMGGKGTGGSVGETAPGDGTLAA